MFDFISRPSPLHGGVKFLLAVWFALLLPWFPFAALAGLAFAGGPKWSSYLFVWSLWTYPLILFIGFWFRRKAPVLSLLPVFNVIGFFVGGSYPRGINL